MEHNGVSIVPVDDAEFREKINWGYVAGFFDGEGTVTLEDAGVPTTRLGFTNTNRRSLERIQSFIGVGSLTSSDSSRYNVHANTCYNLRVGGHKDVARVARQMLPFSVVKREKLQAILSYIGRRDWNKSWMHLTPTRERLVSLYWRRGLSCREIARVIGVTSPRGDVVVRTMMVRLGVPFRSRRDAALNWRKRP